MRLHTAALLLLLSTSAWALEADSTVAKERLHKSLALPTSYADVKPAPKYVSSKPADEGDNIAHMDHIPDTPCPYHKGMVREKGTDLLPLSSFLGPILSEAAHEVFGVEQIISSQVHNIFEDLMSGPTIPRVLDMLEGAAEQASAALPALPTLLPPFLRGAAVGPHQPITLSSSSGSSRAQPVFGMIITSGSSADKPSFEQQVIISSSDPSRLSQLADMFEQNLMGSSSSFAGFGRKLKAAVSSKVQAADVAQVLLNAARKLRAVQAL